MQRSKIGYSFHWSNFFSQAQISIFGIVILQTESEEAARDIMNEDPAVKGRIFRAELFAYGMSLFNSRDFPKMLD